MAVTEKRGAYLLLLIPPLLWAGNVVLARGLSDAIAPLALSFWRWAGALLILLPLAARQTRRDWQLIRRQWRLLLLLALLGIAIFNSLLYTAVRTTTALNCALLQAVMPATILLVCRWLFQERFNLRQGCGVALCLLGALSIVLHGDLWRLFSMRLTQGDIWMLIAVVCYAFYSALLRRVEGMHPLSLLLATVAPGCLMLLPFYLAELSWGPAWEISGPVAAGILFVALGPSVIAYICWIRGVATVGAASAGLFINLIPLFAALLAVVLLGESWHGYHSFGAGLILSGMLLFHIRSWQK